MQDAVVNFIVLTLLAALFSWALSRFPTLDAGIVSFVRTVIYVVLTVLALNLILVLIFGKGLRGYLGSS